MIPGFNAHLCRGGIPLEAIHPETHDERGGPRITPDDDHAEARTSASGHSVSIISENQARER